VRAEHRRASSASPGAPFQPSWKVVFCTIVLTFWAGLFVMTAVSFFDAAMHW
jgi:hypothetical protein